MINNDKVLFEQKRNFKFDKNAISIALFAKHSIQKRVLGNIINEDILIKLFR